MMRAGQGGAGAGSSLMRSVTRSLPASSPAPDSTLGLPHQCTPTNKVTKATCHSGSEPPESPADTQGFASPGECLQCGGGPSYAAPTLRTISLSSGNRDKKRLLTCDSFFYFFFFINWRITALRRAWQPTPVCMPGGHHGQRDLVGYSPWGHTELDTTERLSLHARITALRCCDGLCHTSTQISHNFSPLPLEAPHHSSTTAYTSQGTAAT